MLLFVKGHQNRAGAVIRVRGPRGLNKKQEYPMKNAKKVRRATMPASEALTGASTVGAGFFWGIRKFDLKSSGGSSLFVKTTRQERFSHENHRAGRVFQIFSKKITDVF